MAEVRSSEGEEETNNTLNEIKKELEGWREVLLPLDRVFNWDKPYHPAILVGVTTLLFVVIWYFEPSILTTVSLLGLLLSLIDFLVPILGPSVFKAEWTGVQEKQYGEVCERIMHSRDHVLSFKHTMSGLKADKPKVYFMVVIGLLAVFAWIGGRVDNLFLTYFFVTLMCLLPGLRRHGIIQKYFRGVGILLKRLIFGKPKKEAKKSD